MDDLVRALSVFIQQQSVPGELRGTKVTFTRMPASEYGLEPGSLFEIDGIVRVSRLDFSVLDTGVSGAGESGEVTVSIV
jgi:hypothetical protein